MAVLRVSGQYKGNEEGRFLPAVFKQNLQVISLFFLIRKNPFSLTVTPSRLSSMTCYAARASFTLLCRPLRTTLLPVRRSSVGRRSPPVGHTQHRARRPPWGFSVHYCYANRVKMALEIETHGCGVLRSANTSPVAENHSKGLSFASVADNSALTTSHCSCYVHPR